MSVAKKTGIGYAIVLAMCVLFLICLMIGCYQADSEMSFDDTKQLAVEKREDGRERFYSVALPEAFANGQSLLFKSTHATVGVLLDDEVVYTFGTQKRIAGKSPGTYWHVVPLPDASDGRELTIHQTTVYNTFYGSAVSVRYGSRGDCLLALLSDSLYVMVTDAIVIMMGLVCLLMFAKAVKRNEQRGEIGFLWIGLFALTIALWSLRKCGFLQFLIPSAGILYFVDIQMLFLAVVPLNLFVHSLSRSKWRTGFLWMAAVYLAGVVIGTLLQLMGIMDIIEMLRGLHALIAFNAVYMLLAIHWESRENRGSMVGRLRGPLYTMIVFGILEMVYYYMPMMNGSSIFLPSGVMIFVLMLIWQQIEEHYQMLEEQKLLYYEKLAKTDMLTGALNRNAYEDMLKYLARRENGYGAVLFDLNDLKFINDHYGHEKGDEAIKCCYELIMTAFGEKGKCYRIGGDEFLVLLIDDESVEHGMAYFSELVARKKECLAFPFDVALGYAAFDAEKDGGLCDTIKRSDERMYLDKKRKKQAHSLDKENPQTGMNAQRPFLRYGGKGVLSSFGLFGDDLKRRIGRGVCDSLKDGIAAGIICHLRYIQRRSVGGIGDIGVVERGIVVPLQRAAHAIDRAAFGRGQRGLIPHKTSLRLRNRRTSGALAAAVWQSSAAKSGGRMNASFRMVNLPFPAFVAYSITWPVNIVYL